jgi:hypothetical protein
MDAEKLKRLVSKNQRMTKALVNVKKQQRFSHRTLKEIRAIVESASTDGQMGEIKECLTKYFSTVKSEPSNG